MIRLFLANQEVELNESVSFSITKQFEDVTSPTDIKNDYSKTVNIPFSENNNKLFGMLFSPDRLTVDGGITGLYFDPYKKIDFRLQWGDSILLQGYAKVVSIDKQTNGGSYEITLNGELGKVFQEMKKITFDTTTEEAKYLIDGSKYVEETIDKDLIYKLWTSKPNLDDLRLQEKFKEFYDVTTGKVTITPNIDYNVEDIIGFAPNNSFDENFDYKIFQEKNSNSTKSFAEVLDNKANGIEEGKTYADYTGINADTVIGNGLLPRDIGEYRSYMQLPYIYFNKLFQIFEHKSKELTGYSFELDNSWFSEFNPYWSRYVYMLKQLNSKMDIKSYSSTFPNTSLGYFMHNDNDPNHKYIPSLRSPINWMSDNTFLSEVRTDFKAKKFDNITFNTPLACKLILADTHYGTPGNLATRNYVILDGFYLLNIAFRLKDMNGNVVFTSVPYVLHDNNTTNFKGNGIEIAGIPKVSNGRYEFSFNINLGMSIDRNVVGDDFTIEYAVYATGVSDPLYYDTIFYDVDSPSGGDIMRVFPNVLTIQVSPTNVTVTAGNNKRSKSKFTLNDLWNNEFHLFDTIVNYCKRFRIGIFCDDVEKKIIFKPLSTYFNEYSILDWTDKLDMSKTYHIQPITFENKYLLFNYEKSDLALNKLYNEKFGKNFGEFKLVTEYEFNTSEKKLFDKSNVVIASTDTCLSWENIYTDMSIVYILPAEITISNKDKDNKNISIFGSAAFYKGISKFDTTSNLRSVKITDDTDLQIFTQTYFYTQDGQDGTKINVLTYPILDITNGEHLCTYTRPSMNFTYSSNLYDNTIGIYTNFWENYLNERYNKQNKIITCYLRLTPYDVANFQYNNFIQIGNQLYMVNKIYDYQIDENESTKVDLITIQDIKGYITNNFTPDKIFEVYNRNGDVWDYENGYIGLSSNEPTLDSYKIYITSSTPVKVEYLTNNLSDVDVIVDGNALVNGETFRYGKKVPVTFQLTAPVEERVEGKIRFTNETGQSITLDVVIIELMS